MVEFLNMILLYMLVCVDNIMFVTRKLLWNDHHNLKEGETSFPPNSCVIPFPDPALEAMCQHLYMQKDYKTLSHLILMDKRTHRLCQPFIEQLKLRGQHAHDILCEKYDLTIRRHHCDCIYRQIEPFSKNPTGAGELIADGYSINVDSNSKKIIITRDGLNQVDYIYRFECGRKPLYISILIKPDLSYYIEPEIIYYPNPEVNYVSNLDDISDEIPELFEDYVNLYLRSVDSVYVERQRQYFEKKPYKEIIGKTPQEAFEILDKLGWHYSPEYPPEHILRGNLGSP